MQSQILSRRIDARPHRPLLPRSGEVQAWPLRVGVAQDGPVAKVNLSIQVKVASVVGVQTADSDVIELVGSAPVGGERGAVVIRSAGAADDGASGKVVGDFPDGNRALMLVAARLRHVAGTKWGTRKYLDMERLNEQNREEIPAAVA